jgi:hypothetical protein
MQQELLQAMRKSQTLPPAVQPHRSGVWRIIAFFVCCAVVAVAVHGAINHGLRSIETSQFGAFNTVVSGQANAGIVISGSSRALCHYDPRIIQEITGLSAYNIGMNASQIDVQLAVLKTYLRHNRKPKLIIQNLDLFSLETTERGKIYDPGFFMPYLSEPELYDTLRHIDSSVWKWKHLPLYGYAVEDLRFTWAWGLLGLVNVNPPETHHRGFNPRSQRWNSDFDAFKASVETGVSYRIDPKGLQDLEAILSLCRENGIAILLVYSPEFVEMQRLEQNRAEIITTFKGAAARFAVELLD